MPEIEDRPPHQAKVINPTATEHAADAYGARSKADRALLRQNRGGQRSKARTP